MALQPLSCRGPYTAAAPRSHPWRRRASARALRIVAVLLVAAVALLALVAQCVVAAPSAAAAADSGAGTGPGTPLDALPTAGPRAPGVPRRYEPPVQAPVSDPFRPPLHRFGPGNRGLEYATRPGQPVRAIGDGRVAFAGQVGGRLVISIDHPDGLRSSLVGLATLGVARGEWVRRGQVVALATASLHLGVRRDGVYLDPASLFDPAGPAILVPIDGGGRGARRTAGFGRPGARR